MLCGGIEDGGEGVTITAQKREVVIKPRRDGCAGFAEERLQWSFEERCAVGVEGMLLGVDCGYLTVLGLFCGCRGGGVVV